MDEIRQTREATLQKSVLFNPPIFRMNVEGAVAAFYALMCFVLVNLLGFAFVGVRAVVRWVAQGFKASA